MEHETLEEEMRALAQQFEVIIRKESPSFLALAVVSAAMTEASAQEKGVPFSLLEKHIVRMREIIAERKAKEEA